MASAPSRLSLILRSRLLHFVALGGLIFALAPRPRSLRDIELDSAFLAAIEQAQGQRLGRAGLSDDQRAEVRARAIEDEILYREALRLGLDRADTIGKQRLIQKVLFLAEDLAGATRPPTESELQSFFAATREQWTRPAQVRLVHVYAGPDHRGQLAALRKQLDTAEPAPGDEPPPVGEAFPLPRSVRASRDELARDYGAAFADAVFALGTQSWSDPIQSKFGWHLVKVLDRTAPGPAAYEDVKGKLQLTYLMTRKKKAVADFLRQAAERYRITIDGQRIGTWQTSSRVAPERSPAGGD